MRPHAGFTLIEVAVVLLLITIVLGMVGLRLDNDMPLVRDESARLRLVLQAAQEQAAFSGQVLGLALEESGYRFARLNDKNEFEALESDLLRAYAFPEGVRMSDIVAEGEGHIVISPTGELTTFNATLAKGGVAWRIEGSANGRIQTQPL